MNEYPSERYSKIDEVYFRAIKGARRANLVRVYSVADGNDKQNIKNFRKFLKTEIFMAFTEY